jgi:hypothetical protein
MQIASAAGAHSKKLQAEQWSVGEMVRNLLVVLALQVAIVA